jgi:hypothetical protein
MTPLLRSRRVWLRPAEFCEATGWGAPRTYRALREGRLHGRDLNAGTGKRARWRVFASEAERDRRGATP